MGRLLAVGDIHGYRTKLSALMKKVQPTQEDRVIFLGDYIDRGPDSPGVINYLIEFAREFPNTVFLAGNHDHLFVSMLSKMAFFLRLNLAARKKPYNTNQSWRFRHTERISTHYFMRTVVHRL